MELRGLWKLSIPEIKVYRRKTGTWSIRTQSFRQGKPKTGDINYEMIAHGNDMAETWTFMMLSFASAIITGLS